MKLLYAEDEPDLRRSLCALLRKKGYETDEAENGKQALEMAWENDYDLMIFDILMEEMTGLEALKCIRQNNNFTPVLLLTARDGIGDKIAGLDAGANDYLTKPFSTGELLARIRALTRGSGAKRERLTWGSLTLDMEKTELSAGGAAFKLSRREMEVMEILMRHGGRAVSTLKMKQKVWGLEADEKTIPLYLSFLNKKLSIAGAGMKISEKSGMILLEQIIT